MSDKGRDEVASPGRPVKRVFLSAKPKFLAKRAVLKVAIIIICAVYPFHAEYFVVLCTGVQQGIGFNILSVLCC